MWLLALKRGKSFSDFYTWTWNCQTFISCLWKRAPSKVYHPSWRADAWRIKLDNKLFSPPHQRLLHGAQCVRILENNSAQAHCFLKTCSFTNICFWCLYIVALWQTFLSFTEIHTHNEVSWTTKNNRFPPELRSVSVWSSNGYCVVLGWLQLSSRPNFLALMGCNSLPWQPR